MTEEQHTTSMEFENFMVIIVYALPWEDSDWLFCNNFQLFPILFCYWAMIYGKCYNMSIDKAKGHSLIIGTTTSSCYLMSTDNNFQDAIIRVLPSFTHLHFTFNASTRAL